MFRPGDAKYRELLELADLATRNQLRDRQRPRWRELVSQLLGSIEEQAIAAKRQYIRAPAELEVDILAPEEMASLATSTIGAGGLALRIAEEIPVGTLMDMSIKVPQRKMPLFVKAQVVWSHPGSLGVSFVDLFQNDRELLEAIAVRSLLEGGE